MLTCIFLDTWVAIIVALIWTITFVWAAYCTAKLFAASRYITKLKRELKSYRYALQFYGHEHEHEHEHSKGGKHLLNDNNNGK